VPPLARDEIDAALTAGAVAADELVNQGRIVSALLRLQGQTRAVGAARLAPSRRQA
jgi:hypothetical protein